MLYKKSAFEISQLLRKNECDLAEVVSSFANRTLKLDPEIGAFEFFSQEYLQLELERVKGNESLYREMCLFGIPVAVKDIFNVEEYPNAMGTAIWKNYYPKNDARSVSSIRQRGGIIFGKTVTAEFAVNHLDADKTKNPWNSRFIPGTSSTGSAVAVACRMVPVALGSQTAGSIGRPASYNGVIGFKPSFGLVPRTGVLKTADTLDTIGFFSNYIDDLKVLLDAVRVRGPDYPVVNQKLLSNKFPRKLRIAVLNSGLKIFDAYSRYVFDALSDLTDKLCLESKLQISQFSPPEAWNELHNLHNLIYNKSLSYYFLKEGSEVIRNVSDSLKARLQIGLSITVQQYKECLSKQTEHRFSVDEVFKDIDVIITPTTAGQAPLFGELERNDTNLIWTLLGLPSVSIPLFLGPDRMPFGLLLVGKRYSDYELLSAAETILRKTKLKQLRVI